MATTRDPTRDWPVYWFGRLEQAIAKGDFALALEAQQQLERLGVSVTFRPLPGDVRFTVPPLSECEGANA
jgi:hypothetical protein